MDAAATHAKSIRGLAVGSYRGHAAMVWPLSAFADEAGPAVDEQITALRRAGLKRVDLRSVDQFNIADLPLDHAEQVRRKLDDAGIAVAMLGSPIGKIDISDDFKIDLDRLTRLGQLSSILDCRNVRLFSYYNKQELPQQQWQDQSLDRLRRLRDLAGQLGLTLFHENERDIFGDRLEQVQILAEQLRDGQAFKLIFDFDNFHQSGDDVWANWQQLRDVTDSLHLKDSDENNQHVPVGQGAGCVRRIVADAVARKWSGPVSVEPHLSHSEAVMATGPSGTANEQFAKLSPADCFHIAVVAARKLLDELNIATT